MLKSSKVSLLLHLYLSHFFEEKMFTSTFCFNFLLLHWILSSFLPSSLLYLLSSTMLFPPHLSSFIWRHCCAVGLWAGAKCWKQPGLGGEGWRRASCLSPLVWLWITLILSKLSFSFPRAPLTKVCACVWRQTPVVYSLCPYRLNAAVDETKGKKPVASHRNDYH